MVYNTRNIATNVGPRRIKKEELLAKNFDKIDEVLQ